METWNKKKVQRCIGGGGTRVGEGAEEGKIRVRIKGYLNLEYRGKQHGTS